MAKGDHIKVNRIAYFHHGIDIGDGTVVHFTGGPENKIDAEIKRTSMEYFLNGGQLEIVEYSKAKSSDEVVQEALRHGGEVGYNLIANNCEHFARYCKTGDFKSEQVENAVASTAGSTAAAVGMYASVGAIATAGSVVGVSGPGVMAGLAAIGPGGAVGGVLALAVAPAICSNLAIFKLLQDDDKLCAEERESRAVGKGAAIAGTAAGAA